MTVHQPPAEALPSPLPEVESIFPFSLEDITELHRTLANPPELSMQRGIVELREHGRAGDMLTTIYGAHFDGWHIENGRMPADSPEDVTAYKIAQLYGLRMASDRYYRLTGERVRADDPDAYDAARQAVLNSYDVRPAPEALSEWEVEVWRESVHGEDSLLSATLGFAHEKLMAHYGQLFDERMSIPEDRIYNALYRGMTDSAIFFNTYLRAKLGLPVELFEGVQYQQISDGSELFVPGRDMYILPEGNDVTHQMNLLPGETPAEFLIRSGWFEESTLTVHGRSFHAQRMAIQSGPNEYRIVYKLTLLPGQEGVELADYDLDFDPEFDYESYPQAGRDANILKWLPPSLAVAGAIGGAAIGALSEHQKTLPEVMLFGGSMGAITLGSLSAVGMMIYMTVRDHFYRKGSYSPW